MGQGKKYFLDAFNADGTPCCDITEGLEYSPDFKTEVSLYQISLEFSVYI